VRFSAAPAWGSGREWDNHMQTPPPSKQAHGGNSRPATVNLERGFKTNIPMTQCKCTPAPGQKLKPTLYRTNAALNGNGTN